MYTETFVMPSYLLMMSVGLTILSTDSTTFFLPLTYYYGSKDKQWDISCLIITYIILLTYGILRLYNVYYLEVGMVLLSFKIWNQGAQSSIGSFEG